MDRENLWDSSARAVRPYWSSEVPHEQLMGNFEIFLAPLTL